MGHTVIEDISIQYRREGSRYLARCPDFDLVCHAPTKKEALEILREGLKGLLDLHAQKNTLHEFLVSRGFEKKKSEESAPKKRDPWTTIPLWLLNAPHQTQPQVS